MSYRPPTFLMGGCHGDDDPSKCLLDALVGDNAPKTEGAIGSDSLDSEDRTDGQGPDNSSDSSADGLGAQTNATNLQSSCYIQAYDGLPPINGYVVVNYLANLIPLSPAMSVAPSGAASSGQTSAFSDDGLQPLAPGVTSINRITGVSGVESGYTITSIISEAAVTVPEPSTWAMALVGFAGLGAAMLRKRSIRGAALIT
jgi:hypothetical protein